MEAFKNRLHKRYKHLKKWARRENISAFRIYNWDIPEYPFTVDKYNEHAVVYIFQRNEPLSEEDSELLPHIVSEVLQIDETKIFVKSRQKQKGKSQYNQLSDQAYQIEIKENGLTFLLNLSDYLDTGIFLDHRNSRKIIMDEASGKSVLNLFAYTGSFSIAAMAGGAKLVKTVDMSNTYLQWTEQNIRLNKQQKAKHQLLKTDILNWISEKQKDRFDLVILDPPSFSNSKSMDKSFDIQRDHSSLIEQTAAMLTDNGKIFFSTNKRKFKMDEALKTDFRVEEITSFTTPEDFRNKPPHQTYWISVK